jgi:acetylglutamate kinase
MESVVLKISGGLTDQFDDLGKIVSWVRTVRLMGHSVTIVHGGGKQINALSASLGFEVKQLKGRRITDQNALDVLLYTVGGSVNAGLVSSLRKAGMLAVGLTGADAGLTTARKRAPLIIDGESVDFQLVGEIDSVNPSFIQVLHHEKLIPVIGCLTWSEVEGILNINADTFAIEIASSIHAKRLIMLMEPAGVMDPNGNILTSMTAEIMNKGISEGWIRDGMIPKLFTGFKAISSGVPEVLLTNPEGLVSNTGTILHKSGGES